MSAAKLLLPLARRLTLSSTGKVGSTSELLDRHHLSEGSTSDNTTPPSSPDMKALAHRARRQQRKPKRSSSLTPSFTFGADEDREEQEKKSVQKRLSHDVGTSVTSGHASDEVALAKDRYQLIFMGAGGVGKTSLISR